MPEPRRHRLCSTDKFEVGEVRDFTIGHVSLAVARTPGGFYAMRNICPHHGAMLSKGTLTGTNLPSEVGQFCYGRDREILRCPWHSWEFDVTTGRALHDPESARVKTYPVAVEDGELIIDLGAPRDARKRAIGEQRV